MREDEKIKCGESHDEEVIEAFAGMVPDLRFSRRHGSTSPDLHVRIASVRTTLVSPPLF